MTHDHQAALEAAARALREARTLAAYITLLDKSDNKPAPVLVQQARRFIATDRQTAPT